MIKLIIADDQMMLLEGLRMMLEREADLAITGEATNGQEALDLVVKEKPDIILADIRMPELDGIEMTRALKAHFPEVNVIAMTMYEEDSLIIDMLMAGASGYLMKSARKEKLLEAIHAVHAKGRYFCDSTSAKLMQRIGKSQIEIGMKKSEQSFTELETKIIRLICGQLSSKEIADRLDIGVRTVESYRNKIFDKMDVVNMAGLVIYAIKHGLYDISKEKPDLSTR